MKEAFRKTGSGFTLVELAIVLVIIGLLVGGVLAGQELINQAKIRSVIRQVSEMDVAANTFRAKYGKIPGDFNRASMYGINHPKDSGTANLALTVNSGNNGNGDGLLQDSTGKIGYESGALPDGEMLNIFVMLSNTELIKGTFTQTDGCSGGTCNTTIGTGIPVTALNDGMMVLTEMATNRFVYALGVLNNLTILDPDSMGNTMTTEMAFALDSKLDDGNPMTGAVRPYHRYPTTTPSQNSGNCINGSQQYNLVLTTQLCSVSVRASI